MNCLKPFNCVQKNEACLKCYQQNVFTHTHIFNIYIYIYQEDLALNNLHLSICHKTKPNHICGDLLNTKYMNCLKPFNCVQKNEACLKCYQQNVFTHTHIFNIYIYIYQEDLALNNLHLSICHKTKPNHICGDLLNTKYMNCLTCQVANCEESSACVKLTFHIA